MGGDKYSTDPGSAEAHAAEALSVEIVAPLDERPLVRAWRARTKDGQEVTLSMVRDDAPDVERERFDAAVGKVHSLAEVPAGILRVRGLAPSRHAFLTDLWTLGSAKDLATLGWPRRRRLDFVRRAAQAVQALHDAGVVHGCMSEDNVLLDDEFRPVLAEAGAVAIHALIARGGDAASYAALAAPEVNEGVEPDARSDVFSLGRLIQHVLPGDDLQQLADVVRRCTAPTPAGRYPSARQVVEAIDATMAAMPAEAAPSPTARRPPDHRKADAVAGVGGSDGAPSAEPGPPARWPAPVGLLLLVVAVGAAILGMGASPGLRAALSGALVVGAGLLAWSVRPKARTSLPLRIAFALAAGAMVTVADPLDDAYRAADSRALHGSVESRRAAVEQIVARGRDFQGMSLAGVDLTGVDLRGADLRGADLARAILSRAQLWGALLRGASLADADLGGTDLREASIGDALHVESARCDGKTLLSAPWHCQNGVLRDTLEPQTPPAGQDPAQDRAQPTERDPEAGPGEAPVARPGPDRPALERGAPAR